MYLHGWLGQAGMAQELDTRNNAKTIKKVLETTKHGKSRIYKDRSPSFHQTLSLCVKSTEEKAPPNRRAQNMMRRSPSQQQNVGCPNCGCCCSFRMSVGHLAVSC